MAKTSSRKELVPIALGALLAEISAAGALGPLGLTITSEMSFERWVALGALLGQAHDGTKWAIADWVNYGEAVYGEKYAQAVEVTKRSLHTLQNYAWVGNRVDLARRRVDLSFTHHAAVAPLDDAGQTKWLARAAAEGWSAAKLRDEVKAEQPTRARPQWTPPGPDLDEGEREVIEAYRGLRERFPILVTPETAKVALEATVIVPAIPPPAPILPAPVQTTCPACGYVLTEGSER